ncbi:hypothetical protein [Streptomyces sp. NPDC048650]|uniref:hypothetical protein n=1 Tax=unclassified Streptomyces TaxID=2593676 RepID=UPI00371C89BE
MTQSGQAEAMVDRIMAIDWMDESRSDRHSNSRSWLMVEYLRRSSLWVQEFDGDDAWPFFDVAARVDPSVRADAELVDRLDDFTSDYVGGFLRPKMLRAMVHWAALDDSGDPRVIRHLPDPFEPLIVMFERGPGLVVENGFVDFSDMRVAIKTWRDHISAEPAVAMDFRSLDALDSGQ